MSRELEEARARIDAEYANEDGLGPRADWLQPETEAERHARMVGRRVRALRVDREARAVLAAEGRPVEPFDAGTLADVLARPAEPRARVDQLIPWQASTLLVAQRKAGKTTLLLNLARCLLTGEPFLGSLAVRPVADRAKVALLNYEVAGAQVARWAAEVGTPADRLFLVNLRGRRNPMADPDDRARLAELLRAQRVESLLVDPFGRAYSGASQNDAGEVGRWLTDLDTFARAEAGALDVVLTAHAGWNGERSRGSSALEDWADVIVTLNRDEDSPDRYLRATGRDVELDEDRLDFDAATRALRLSGDGSRKTSLAARRDADTAAAIVECLRAAASEGLSGRALSDALDRKDADFTRVRDGLVRDRVLAKLPRSGRGGGHQYRLAIGEGTEHTENLPNAPSTNLPNLPIKGEVRSSVPSDANMPSTTTGRFCADCGAPVAVNRVRCQPCIVAMNQGTP